MYILFSFKKVLEKEKNYFLIFSFTIQNMTENKTYSILIKNLCIFKLFNIYIKELKINKLNLKSSGKIIYWL